MVKLKFCANISWLYKDYPVLERYQHARDDGFEGVEMAWPYEFSTDELVAAKTKAGVEQVLINTGCVETLGNAAVADKKEKFQEELDQAIQYAKALDCKRVHIMAGRVERSGRPKAYETYVGNLMYAADKLKKEDMIGVIEPINKYDVPGYFLDDTMQAVGILELVDRPNLMYQLDFYHLQIMNGDLTRNLKNLFPRVGHIQISQVPGRNQPSFPGEINYPYIFSVLEDLDYNGWIGCEYKPSKETSESLDWFKTYVEYT